jgi:hypothetical protein
VRRLKAEWRNSLEYVADQANKATAKVPRPEVRLPTVDEAKAVACTFVALPAC